MIDRRERLVRKAVQAFNLELHPFCVLTEAATGHFMLTPLIAAIGGARMVYALARDSKYGSAAQVAHATRALAHDWGVASHVQVLEHRDDPRLEEADIVTNLGAVRPIDAALLDRLSPRVAVALMWETWEFRAQDLDLDLCRRRGIPVLGTDEGHADLRIFGYLPQVAIRLLHELGIEVFRSTVAVVGSGPFADETCRGLAAAGAVPTPISPLLLREAPSRVTLASADAILFVEHHERRVLVGDGGVLAADELHEINPAAVVAHICGGVNERDLDRVGLRHAPAAFAPPGFMSVSTAYVGPRPVIDLHAAGLRVGQALAQARGLGLSGLEAERWALANCSYAQGFDDRHHPPPCGRRNE